MVGCVGEQDSPLETTYCIPSTIFHLAHVYLLTEAFLVLYSVVSIRILASLGWGKSLIAKAHRKTEGGSLNVSLSQLDLYGVLFRTFWHSNLQSLFMFIFQQVSDRILTVRYMILDLRR